MSKADEAGKADETATEEEGKAEPEEEEGDEEAEADGVAKRLLNCGGTREEVARCTALAADFIRCDEKSLPPSPRLPTLSVPSMGEDGSSDEAALEAGAPLIKEGDSPFVGKIPPRVLSPPITSIDDMPRCPYPSLAVSRNPSERLPSPAPWFASPSPFAFFPCPWLP